MMRSDIRITLFLMCPTRMGYGTVYRRSHLLGILPQHARRMTSRAGLPFGLAFGEFGAGQIYVKSADVGVDLNDIAVTQQGDRPADCRLRPDMADAEATGGAGEPAIGDE